MDRAHLDRHSLSEARSISVSVLRWTSAILAVCLAPSLVALGAQVAYIDAQGRSWRQVNEAIAHSWESVAQRCPVDGVTPCSGILGTQDLTGWVWATDQRIAELFGKFMPGITAAGSLSGSPCVLPVLSFLSTFIPTYSGYTTFCANF